MPPTIESGHESCKGRIECVPPGRRKSVPGGSWIRPPRAPRPRLPARLRCSRGGIGRCGLGPGLLPVAAGLEPVAVAGLLEHVDVVGQPVEQGARETLRAEHAGPLVERQVAGDDHRAALVAAVTPAIKLSSRFPARSNAYGSSRHTPRWRASGRPWCGASG